MLMSARCFHANVGAGGGATTTGLAVGGLTTGAAVARRVAVGETAGGSVGSGVGVSSGVGVATARGVKVGRGVRVGVGVARLSIETNVPVSQANKVNAASINTSHPRTRFKLNSFPSEQLHYTLDNTSWQINRALPKS